jgi:hypothetical protein
LARTETLISFNEAIKRQIPIIAEDLEDNDDEVLDDEVSE